MALPVPYSYQQWTGDGATVDYQFNFDFIDQAHIYVYLDGTLVNQGAAASEWQWDGPPADKKVKMGTAPAVGTLLTVRRVTPQDHRIVQWTDGTYLISDDLNTSDTQWLYLIQEHSDIINRILNGSDPIPGPVPPPPFSFWNKYARHSDPNKGTANETAQTIDSVDQLAGDSISPQNGVDAYVMTLGAISSRLDVIVGTGAGYPGAGNVGQQGKLRVDVTQVPNRLYYWETSSAAWVEVKATTGTSATVDVGTTTTLTPGSPATVVNSGTTTAAIFDFGIPKGDKGDPGPGIEYKGPIDPTTTPPTGFTSGDFYVSTAAGTPVAQWAGLSVVAVNDRLIWNGNTSTWDRYSQAWIQSNWTETDSSAPAFIQNKPTLGTMAAQDDALSDGKQYGRQNGAWTEIAAAGGTNIGYTAATDKGTITSSTGTDATVPLADNTNAGLFTATEKTKLAGIAAGAEVNVQSDWNQSSSSADDFIKNKPTITPSPWTLDGTTIKPATATNDVETTASLKTKQVYADAVTLSGTTVTPDFKEGNCFILSGAITTVNAPSNLKVGQTGKFYFLSGATVAGWNTNYKWPGGTAALAPTGLTIVPFYVATASFILMGTSTEDIK